MWEPDDVAPVDFSLILGEAETLAETPSAGVLGAGREGRGRLQEEQVARASDCLCAHVVEGGGVGRVRGTVGVNEALGRVLVGVDGRGGVE